MSGLNKLNEQIRSQSYENKFVLQLQTFKLTQHTGKEFGTNMYFQKKYRIDSRFHEKQQAIRTGCFFKKGFFDLFVEILAEES